MQQAEADEADTRCEQRSYTTGSRVTERSDCYTWALELAEAAIPEQTTPLAGKEVCL